MMIILTVDMKFIEVQKLRNDVCAIHTYTIP